MMLHLYHFTKPQVNMNNRRTSMMSELCCFLVRKGGGVRVPIVRTRWGRDQQKEWRTLNFHTGVRSLDGASTLQNKNIQHWTVHDSCIERHLTPKVRYQAFTCPLMSSALFRCYEDHMQNTLSVTRKITKFPASCTKSANVLKHMWHNENSPFKFNISTFP